MPPGTSPSFGTDRETPKMPSEVLSASVSRVRIYADTRHVSRGDRRTAISDQPSDILAHSDEAKYHRLLLEWAELRTEGKRRYILPIERPLGEPEGHDALR